MQNGSFHKTYIPVRTPLFEMIAYMAVHNSVECFQGLCVRKYLLSQNPAVDSGRGDGFTAHFGTDGEFYILAFLHNLSGL